MPSESYIYAMKAAENYLAEQPADPQQASIELTRVIVAAMIEEFGACKRSMCAKCKTSHAQRFKGGPPMRDP